MVGEIIPKGLQDQKRRDRSEGEGMRAMLSMVFGLLLMWPIPMIILITIGPFPHFTGLLPLSFTVGIGVFIAGLDILTWDGPESILPKRGVVVIGGALFGLAAGLYLGPAVGLFSLVTSVMVGFVWRAAFE